MWHNDMIKISSRSCKMNFCKHELFKVLQSQVSLKQNIHSSTENEADVPNPSQPFFT